MRLYKITLEPSGDEEFFKSPTKAEAWARGECRRRCPEAYTADNPPQEDEDYFLEQIDTMD